MFKPISKHILTLKKSQVYNIYIYLLEYYCSRKVKLRIVRIILYIILYRYIRFVRLLDLSIIPELLASTHPPLPKSHPYRVHVYCYQSAKGWNVYP